jgi:hypothetical protein
MAALPLTSGPLHEDNIGVTLLNLQGVRYWSGTCNTIWLFLNLSFQPTRQVAMACEPRCKYCMIARWPLRLLRMRKTRLSSKFAEHGKPEKVIDPEDFSLTGIFELWIGLDIAATVDTSQCGDAGCVCTYPQIRTNLLILQYLLCLTWPKNRLHGQVLELDARGFIGTRITSFSGELIQSSRGVF